MIRKFGFVLCFLGFLWTQLCMTVSDEDDDRVGLTTMIIS